MFCFLTLFSYNLSISFMVSVINFLFFCNSWSSLFVPFVSYIWQSATLFLFVYFLCLWDIVWCIYWFSVFVWDSFLCFFCLNVYISFWFSASKELTLFHLLRLFVPQLRYILFFNKLIFFLFYFLLHIICCDSYIHIFRFCCSS